MNENKQIENIGKLCIFLYKKNFIKIENILEKYLPLDELKEVKRILYGYNMGNLVEEINLNEEIKNFSKKENFDLKAFKFKGFFLK